MAYKLIAVDLDGTLVNSNRKISERNVQAMGDAVSAGKLFVLSTGRPPQGVADIIGLLNADHPVILFNGALVMTAKTEKILYECLLLGDLARRAVTLGSERGTTVLVWSDGKVYVSGINGNVRAYAENINVTPIIAGSLESAAEGGASKVLWYDTPEAVAVFQDEMRAHFGDSLNCHTSSPHLLEFVAHGASKAIAMERIGAHYGITRDEMIAVGDGYNDLSMIEYAGLGVAMGNAPEAVRERADVVTLTHDDDGVAEVVYKYLLHKG
jgi:hypothetical protein